MKRPASRILAIDPGTREIGIALLVGRDLAYHGVKTIRRRTSPQETLREVIAILRSLITDFHPTVLAVEKTFIGRNRSAALLNVVGDEIQTVGRATGIRVLTFAPSTVKKFVTGNGRAAKEDVAKAVARIYPALRAYLSQATKWRTAYHENMFDAVALGLTAAARAVDRGS